ncbi:MAG TPA: cold shock domain-containing protein [bacterium]
MRGTVTSFDVGKGYGFIRGEDGKEYLVHFMAVKSDVHALKEEVEVEFKPVSTSKGPQAAEVSAIEKTA